MPAFLAAFFAVFFFAVFFAAFFAAFFFAAMDRLPMVTLRCRSRVDGGVTDQRLGKLYTYRPRMKRLLTEKIQGDRDSSARPDPDDRAPTAIDRRFDDRATHLEPSRDAGTLR